MDDMYEHGDLKGYMYECVSSAVPFIDEDGRLTHVGDFLHDFGGEYIDLPQSNVASQSREPHVPPPIKTEIQKPSPPIQNQQTFICRHCSQKFCNSFLLEKHMRGHLSNARYSCPFCSAAFITVSSLLRHQNSHSEAKLFACYECPATFSSSSLLTAHIKKHVLNSQRRSFTCNHCHSAFKSALQYHRHLKSHAVERKSFVCGFCSEVFFSPVIFQRHVKVHKRELPQTCPTCAKPFLKRSKLVKHMKSHEQNE